MFDKLSEKVATEFKAELTETMYDTAKLVIQAIDEASYILALFGGATAILMRVAGSERASKYFWSIQIGYILINGILGDLL
jgi:hypothetical protein